MHVTGTDFPGLLLIEPKVFGDHRGFFMESYNRQLLLKHGVDIEFVQDNHAKSGPAGVLRGLHFQKPPKAQTKLVRVTCGAVYDVVVDLRAGSPTYGKWAGFTLSAENHLQLLVPKGFAHAYLTLTENCEFLYKVDEYYAPDHDSGIIWNDPDLSIEWPMTAPVLSVKDQHLQKFANFTTPFTL